VAEGVWQITVMVRTDAGTTNFSVTSDAELSFSGGFSMVSRPASDVLRASMIDEPYAVSAHRQVSRAWQRGDVGALDQLAREVERATVGAHALDRARLDLVNEVIAFCRADLGRRRRWTGVLRATRALLPG
jgi:hypothetical protein